jgi:hypothetical protein
MSVPKLIIFLFFSFIGIAPSPLLALLFFVTTELHADCPDIVKHIGGGHQFKEYGVNSNETIQAATEIAGQRHLDDISSRETFGGADLSGMVTVGKTFRQMLLEDNMAVRNQGLSHEQVAAPILAALKEVEKKFQSSGLPPAKLRIVDGVASGPGQGPDSEWVDFEFNQISYQVKAHLMMDSFGSLLRQMGDRSNRPISGYANDLDLAGSRITVARSVGNDRVVANYDIVIRRKSDSALFAIDALSPHLISRFGFYQGGAYRRNPADIINFFQLNSSVK